MPPTRKKRRTAPAANAHSKFTSLPYHVLLTVFNYAGAEPTVHHWCNSSFLLSCSTVCRAFYEPAMTELYRNPPTLPPSRAHRLLDTLRSRPELGIKVKRAVFEIDPILLRKTPGHGYFDLAEFVYYAKGMRELWLAHTVDRPPYRSREDAAFWRYPARLWDALGGQPLLKDSRNVRVSGDKTDLMIQTPVDAETEAEAAESKWIAPEAFQPVSLRSWRWSGLFLGIPPDTLMSIYKLPAFQSLERLSLIYIDPSDNPEDPEEYENEMASLIATLPCLSSLEIEVCDILNPSFLRILPETAPKLRLKELRCINCSLLTAESLGAFLWQLTCCGLQHLAILNCRGTSLAFLPALANTPGLISLDFDGNYFSPSSSHRDSDPLYKALLPESHISWSLPETLQRLQLVFLRRWTGVEAAETFLQTLWEHRRRLPHLRRFTLHCILDDVSYRERARLRGEWAARLTRAYLRVLPTPSSTVEEEDEDEDEKAANTVSPSPQPHPDLLSPDPAAAAAAADLLGIRRSVRVAKSRSEEELRRRRKKEAQDAEKKLQDSAADAYGDDDDHQGLVDRKFLNIKMDNARPVEQPWRADDFVDTDDIWAAVGGRRARNRRASAKGRASRGRSRGGERTRTVIVEVHDSGDEEYQD